MTMSKKPSAEQRRKHQKVEEEFHERRLSLAQIQKAESASLEAYQILQDLLVGLRKKRTEEGLSLDDVARASGIDKAYLSRLENGKVINPTFETLYRYAAAIRPIRSVSDLAPA
jgi:ribosome-binding protein aMBF1 (putative translation factor)